MSTLPGQDAWRDAGLTEIDPAGLVDLVHEPDDLTVDEVPLDEEYEPGEPRPDLRDEATVADVTEQAAELPPDDREEYP